MQRVSKKRVRITISLPEEIVTQLDKYAKQNKMDRSHFLERTLELALPLMPQAMKIVEGVFKNAGVRIEKALTEKKPEP